MKKLLKQFLFVGRRWGTQLKQGVNEQERGGRPLTVTEDATQFVWQQAEL